jgi:outer membrane protein assembly factor BamD
VYLVEGALPSAPFQKVTLLMKKLLSLVLLVVLAGCAEKQEVFDPTALFKQAEENMVKGSFEKARKEYQEIQEKAPDRSYDPALMLRIADTYFGEEKYDEARVEYQAFLNYHPVNKDAAYAQFQVAMCSYRQFTTIDRDPEPVHTALKEFETLKNRYPKSIYEEQANRSVALCRDRLAEYELYVGRFYHKKGSYLAAAARFEKLLQDYPGSTAEKDALYYAGLSYKELGRRDDALREFELLATKYPSMQDIVGPLISTLKAK